jgi:hypothetical protein
VEACPADCRRAALHFVSGLGFAGRLEPSTVETPLEPGHHTLRLRSGRYSSQGESFDVADGEVVNFRCHGAMVWPRYVASIVKPNLAISLKRE